MASGNPLGRGRGRGALIFNRDKEVGAKNEEKPGNPADILIKSLSVEPDEAELLPIANALRKTCQTKECAEHIIAILYRRCQEDWKFSRCAAELSSKLSSVEVENELLRNYLLKTIQQDFKDKERLRTEKPQTFIGCLSFLCQLLIMVTDKKGEPLKPLVKPVFEALLLLLDSSANDEEISCAASQLQDLCELLHSLGDADSLRSLKNSIRDRIVEMKARNETKYELLTVIETFAGLTTSS